MQLPSAIISSVCMSLIKSGVLTARVNVPKRNCVRIFPRASRTNKKHKFPSVHIIRFVPHFESGEPNTTILIPPCIEETNKLRRDVSLRKNPAGIFFISDIFKRNDPFNMRSLSTGLRGFQFVRNASRACFLSGRDVNPSQEDGRYRVAGTGRNGRGQNFNLYAKERCNTSCNRNLLRAKGKFLRAGLMGPLADNE